MVFDIFLKGKKIFLFFFKLKKLWGGVKDWDSGDGGIVILFIRVEFIRYRII